MKKLLSIKKRIQGFTLVETAAVIVILSIMITSLVTVFSADVNEQAVDATSEKLQKIDAAINAYFNQKGFLPCAASKNAALSSASFGVSTNCAAVGSSAPAYFESGASADRIRIGAVPTRELNIPDDYAFDGWNNRITYVVAADLAQSSALYNSHTSATTGMTIRDASTNSLHSASPTFISYALIAHGKDGGGATNLIGDQIPVACSGTRNDGENCNNDSIFRDQFVDFNSAAYFDDQVIWRTKSQLNLYSLNPSAGGGSSPDVKYGLWVLQASGAANQPKLFSGWDLRQVPTQLYNTTSVTHAFNQITFPPGDYYIRESHMVCGTGATQVIRFLNSPYTPIVISGITYLDPTAVNKPCAWLTGAKYVTFAVTTVTEAWVWSTHAETTYGHGRGVNTGLGDPYVFSRVEVWQK